jgi:two-component system, NarL family, sensor kinase
MDVSENLKLLQFLLSGMLVMFLLAGGVILFFLIYQRRLHKQQMQISEMESAHKLDLLHSNIESVELERKRIAADLHDEVGSMLSTLRLMIGRVATGSNERTRKIVEESTEMIDQGIATVRRLSHHIMPPGLEMFGLVDSIEVLCEKISDSGKIDASLSPTNTIQRFAPKIELGLYRIAQELTNNTIKHAGASHITFTLDIQTDQIIMTYSDDGKGMDPGLLKNGRGLGLKNIESRVSFLGGNLEWITAPEKGLKTIIILPLYT